MFNLMNKRLNKKGFTLIELIVVIAIIAILAVILLPRFTGFTENANIKSAISDTRNILLIVQALETEGKGPLTDTNVKELVNEYAAGDDALDTTDYEYTGTIDILSTGDASSFSYKIQKGSNDITIYVQNYQVVAGAPATTYLPVVSPHS